MLKVVIRSVVPDRLDDLRGWLEQVNGPRRREALATLVDEGCRHEQAYLIDGAGGPVLVYVMEVEDLERSASAAARSTHAIDAEHRQVISRMLGDRVPAELLLDLSGDGTPQRLQPPRDRPGT